MAIEAGPRKSCTTRMSALFSSSIVATVCRSIYAELYAVRSRPPAEVAQHDRDSLCRQPLGRRIQEKRFALRLNPSASLPVLPLYAYGLFVHQERQPVPSAFSFHPKNILLENKVLDVELCGLPTRFPVANRKSTIGFGLLGNGS